MDNHKQIPARAVPRGQPASPRTRNFWPLCVPGGILMFTRPSGAGTDISAPSTASHAPVRPHESGYDPRLRNPDVRLAAPQIQIARCPAAPHPASRARQAVISGLGDPGRNLHLAGFRFDRAADRTTHVDGPHRPVHRLLQRHQDVALDVAAAFGRFLLRETGSAAKTGPSRPVEPNSCSKKSLNPVPPKRNSNSSLPMPRPRAAWPPENPPMPVADKIPRQISNWRRARHTFCVWPDHQNLIGLVDLLEFFLGPLFVLGHVRVKFPREPAKGLFEFVRRSRRGGRREFRNNLYIERA